MGPNAERHIRELEARVAQLQADFDDCNLHRAAAVRRAEQAEARLQAYEAPNGWRVLADRDARRVLGDPSKSVGVLDTPDQRLPQHAD